VGWQKKGVGHEVFFTEKGRPPKNIGSEGGVQLFIIVEKNLTCNDYCYHRLLFFRIYVKGVIEFFCDAGGGAGHFV
jgi:hypothetical protein